VDIERVRRMTYCQSFSRFLASALLRVDRAPEGRCRWALHQLEPGAGYAVALAADGREWRLCCWNCED